MIDNSHCNRIHFPLTAFHCFSDNDIENVFNIIQSIFLSLMDMVENIVEKEKKCWLPAFSPFPHNVFKSFHRIEKNCRLHCKEES